MQCAKLVEDYDMAHFSAGDLLREHIKSGTADGNMVAEMIKNGQIVPAEVNGQCMQLNWLSALTMCWLDALGICWLGALSIC